MEDSFDIKTLEAYLKDALTKGDDVPPNDEARVALSNMMFGYPYASIVQIAAGFYGAIAKRDARIVIETLAQLNAIQRLADEICKSYGVELDLENQMSEDGFDIESRDAYDIMGGDDYDAVIRLIDQIEATRALARRLGMGEAHREPDGTWGAHRASHAEMAVCPECGATNFASASVCYACSQQL